MKISLGISIIALVFTAAVRAEVGYRVDPISVPAGFTDIAMYSVNNHGQVAGTGNRGTGFQAFLGTTDGSTLIPLPAGWSFALGFGVNDSGQVAGYGFDGTRYQAFIGTAAGSTSIPLPVGWTSAYGWAVNGAGQVIGYGLNGDTTQAFIGTTAGSTPVTLASGSISAFGLALNNFGQVTGYTADGRRSHAFIGTIAGSTALSLPGDLVNAYAYGLNDAGQVAGFGYSLNQVPRAFIGNILIPLPPGSTSTTIGYFPINDLGVVVGTAFAPGASSGWIWDTAQGTRLLNTLVPEGWTIIQAQSINRSGQILSYGRSASYVGYVLLSPLATETLAENSGGRPSTGSPLGFLSSGAMYTRSSVSLNNAAVTAATTTALSVAPSPSIFGKAVALMATVTPGSATGKVTFYDGATLLGVATLSSGTASFTTKLLDAGTRSLRAYYAGDASNTASVSPTVPLTVKAVRGEGFAAAAGSPFTVGSLPYTLAISEFNGDGKADIVTANSDNLSVTVLLGNGSGGFTEAAGSPITVGSGPLSVAAGDLNGDGNMDLAVANSGGNTVTILLGNGTGGFAPAAGSPVTVGFSPQWVAVGDFNGDGKADLVTANASDNNVTVLLGNGSGGFAPASGSPVSVGAFPTFVAVGYFNGDANADLAVANLNDGSVTVLLGNGSGGFAPAAGSPITVGSGPNWVAVGDLNNDGKADLVVPNSNDDNVTVLLGNGTGGFAQATGSPFSVGAGTFPTSVAMGDFNGDGNADLVVANDGTGKLGVWIGNGAGGFAEATGSPFAGADSPWQVAVGDFNGDGVADLVTTDVFNNFVVVLLGTPTPSKAGIFRSGFFWLEDVDGNRQFNNPPDRAFAFGGVAGDIPITGDWNGDGRTKVGVYRPSNGLFVLDYDGDGQFTGADRAYNLGVGIQAGDVPVVGDWNGNGKTKVGLFRQGFFWILDTNGNGVFEQGTDQTFAFGGVAGDLPVVGDWSGDGKSKLGLFRQGFFWILDYNGNGSIDNVNLAGGDKAFAFGGIAGDVPVVGDWNGDGKSKVGVFRSGFFWVLDANGNYQFDGTGVGQDLAFAFGGIGGDKPVIGKW